jgi:hypothetical protein
MRERARRRVDTMLVGARLHIKEYSNQVNHGETNSTQMNVVVVEHQTEHSKIICIMIRLKFDKALSKTTQLYFDSLCFCRFFFDKTIKFILYHYKYYTAVFTIKCYVVYFLKNIFSRLV